MHEDPTADRIISLGELLYTSGPPSAIKIPTFPEQFQKMETPERSIEFAAANVADRVTLGALVKKYAPKRLFEIGTFRGVTAITLAANAAADAVLFTLDLPPYLDTAEVAHRFYDYNSSSGFHQMAAVGAARGVGELLGWYDDVCKIEQLFGDAAIFDFSPFENSIDLFFVDGCHEQSAVLRDTRQAWKCLRPGGLMVWHDYPWDSVQNAIREADLKNEVIWVNGTNVAFCQKQH
jgi:predicted O-methyltransferase YrrM